MDEANAQRYQVGQVWKDQARPGEPDSTITVVRVDQVRATLIISIRLDGLHFRNPHSEGGIQRVFPHLPFSKAAISASVTELVSDHGELGAFEAATPTGDGPSTRAGRASGPSRWPRC